MDMDEMVRLKPLVFDENAIRKALKNPEVNQTKINKILKGSLDNLDGGDYNRAQLEGAQKFWVNTLTQEYA